MNRKSIPDSKIKLLTETSYFISEVSNVKLADNHAFVGHSAFAHKGASTSTPCSKSAGHEHVDRRWWATIAVCHLELAGKMPIILKARQMNVDLDKQSPRRKIVKRPSTQRASGTSLNPPTPRLNFS